MFRKVSNEQILLMAKNSNSLVELCMKFGSDDSRTRYKVKKILLESGFDLEQFIKNKFTILDDEVKLRKIVSESYSYSEILKKFGLSHHNITLKKYIEKFSIPTDHFCRNMHGALRINKSKAYNVEDFCINSNKGNAYIKQVI